MFSRSFQWWFDGFDTPMIAGLGGNSPAPEAWSRWGKGEDEGSPAICSVLAGGRAPQVPARAKVALVGIQRDSRLDPADIGGAQRLLLGPEYRLGCPISAPVRTEGERSGVIAPAAALPLWKVAAAHHLILVRIRRGAVHPERGLGGGRVDGGVKGLDAP